MELIHTTIFELTSREMNDDGLSVLRLQIDSLPRLKPNSNGETKVETQGYAKRFSNSATPATSVCLQAAPPSKRNSY
jgi:hypothetical protein